jgi:hypothetical protein
MLPYLKMIEKILLVDEVEPLAEDCRNRQHIE